MRPQEERGVPTDTQRAGPGHSVWVSVPQYPTSFQNTMTQVRSGQNLCLLQHRGMIRLTECSQSTRSE